MALPVRHRKDDIQHRSRTAPPSPWDPFAPFDDIYQRMGQFVRAVRDDLDSDAWWSPPVDVEETDDTFVIEVDLPGVAREDLSIEWSGRELTVRGEIKERERSGMLRRQARHVGAFHYSMTLPGEIDGDNITADLRDGVLTIHAPKSQTTKPRRIELSS